VLEVVEEELEERYMALGRHAPAPRLSQDATYLQRLAKANLPPSELSLCKELLRKLVAIDGVRKSAEAVRAAVPCGTCARCACLAVPNSQSSAAPRLQPLSAAGTAAAAGAAEGS
jgi:hypothetical protein